MLKFPFSEGFGYMVNTGFGQRFDVFHCTRLPARRVGDPDHAGSPIIAVRRTIVEAGTHLHIVRAAFLQWQC